MKLPNSVLAEMTGNLCKALGLRPGVILKAIVDVSISLDQSEV